MTVVRYECPRCQSVFVPAEAPQAGTYARCPTCGSLSVPAATPPIDDPTGDDSDDDQRSAPTAHVASTPGMGGVFASLMPMDAAPARAPTDETTMPPQSAGGTNIDTPVASPGAGGLFTSLLMSAPDLELSGKRAPIRDSGPPPSVTGEVTLPPNMARVPRDISQDATRELGLARGSPSSTAAGENGVANPWEVAGTNMIQGPVTDPGSAAAAAAAAAARKKAPPPTGDNSPYLDKDTFSDAEFESMLGGSFAPGSNGVQRAPRGDAPPPDSWVISNPGAPPPLKKARDEGTPPPPPAGKKGPLTPAQLIAGLPPIPKVASLGPVPSLKDGVTAVRVGVLLVGALLVGTFSGLAIAPPPEKPPSTGTEGAKVKLAEARKMLSRNQDSEAVGVLQAALALDGKLAEAHRDLGVAYARQEKFEEAARAYETYLELAPKAADAYEIESTLKLYRQKK